MIPFFKDHGTSNKSIILSNNPCTTSKPAVLLQLTAQIRLSLRAPTSTAESLRTTSETSNIFNGNGIFLFAEIVFKMPASKVVLQT